MLSVEQEIVKVTKCKQRRDQDRQEFLAEVTEQVHNLNDDDWDTLSNAGQEWANRASSSHNKGQSIIDFPTEDDEQEETEDAADAGASEDAAQKEAEPEEEGAKDRKAAKSKVKKAKKVKTEKPAKAKLSVLGVKARIKKLIVKNPKVGVQGVLDALTKAGIKPPSRFLTSTIIAEFKHSLKVLQSAGMLKPYKG